MGNYTALIVDDEEDIRFLVGSALKMLDFDIAGEASNGEEATDKFRELTPDIVILDENMPDVKGSDFLSRIRGEYDNSCIVMLTASSDSFLLRKCMSLGINHFMVKTTPFPILIERIKHTWIDFLKKRDTQIFRKRGR